MKYYRNFVKSIRPIAWLPSLFLASAACSPATNPVHTIDTAPQTKAPQENGETSAVDGQASTADGQVFVAGEFRAFPSPPTLAMPSPTQVDDLPGDNNCRRVSGAVYDYEHTRHIAALDAEMRRLGGLVLPLRPQKGLKITSYKVGHEFRGPKGERLMIVGHYNECSTPRPFVLSADYEIFAVSTTLVGTKKRVVTACSADCRGCGVNAPDLPAIAEVPPGSRVVQSRRVKVPIATELVFRVNDTGGPPCQPRQ